MNVKGKAYRTVWLEGKTVKIIDQRKLPHSFEIETLKSTAEVIRAIREMHVRGAPAIGMAAAYGMYLAALEACKSGDFERSLQDAALKLKSTRPTAINLAWAVECMLQAAKAARRVQEKVSAILKEAQNLAEEEVENCRRIGQQGLGLLEQISRRKAAAPVRIMTHCNAGWLACVDYGTATAPIYEAVRQGMALHVWVSETRPRNQGAKLTAWELEQQGVSYSLIVDNAAGLLMKKNLVDLVIVGGDRVTRCGDVANKIGTYLKALAAKDNNVPFYVAIPSSSIDWKMKDGLAEIPIEERDANEVRYVDGLFGSAVGQVLICPPRADAVNYAFDVTPAGLITGIITERGVCQASETGLRHLFPEKTEAAA